MLCAYGASGESNTKKNRSLEIENLLILQALDAQQHGQFTDAAEYFKKLYERNGQDEYLKSSIKLFLMTNDTGLANDLVKKGLKKYPKDFEYERFNIAKLLKENKITVAKEASLSLLKKDRSEQNLKLVGTIFFYMQDYNSSLNYFNEAYAISNDEELLMQIVDIKLKLGKIDEAILNLETYVRMNNCTINSCYKLIEIYSVQKNIDKVLSVYERLYEKFENDDYAQKIFEILMFQNKRSKVIGFLEKSGYRPDILIELYTIEKEYDKAIDLAKNTYKKTGDLEYLSKVAILEYESADNKTDALLSLISEKFENSISNQSDALYLNYYGYLLIDHDMNVSKGIEFVKKALEHQPDSPYYQDSLAWGLYKQKKCKEAYDIIQRVIKVLNDEEILEHFALIKECAVNDSEVKK
jgi:tetratricopeptide (TPR) repeat protein